jgi:CubicO group peptidase (beta-lactamase class C family)
MTASTYDFTRVPAARRALGYRHENGAWLEEPVLGPGAFGAMGGLLTSANDYARYVAWVLAAWPPRAGAEQPVLARASVRETARPANYATVVPGDKDGCARSVAYGLGVNSFNDCVLGFHFGHSGGLPGYGSNVLFLPTRGVGVFAFTNRTYAPASRAVREAANRLVRAGTFPVRQLPVDASLAAMLEAALRIYDARDVLVARELLAGNFLLDRGADLRNSELAALRKTLGACKPATPETDSALSTSVVYPCERGKLKVRIVLAPTTPVSVQTLDYEAQTP